MKKALISVLISDAVLYTLQFLIIPLFYDNIRQVNEGMAVIVISTILTSGISMFVLTDKLRLWLLGFVLYIALIIVYTPRGAYHIGITGIDLDGLHSYYDASQRTLGIVLVAIAALIAQLTTWGVVKLIKIFF
jgi:hypothetical protein